MEYFITFIDDYSRYRYVYLLKHKSEALENFKNYKIEVGKQLGQPIRSINNGRGGEYEVFDEFCKGKWIKHIYTMPYKLQQNGIAERCNRTLMEMSRSMMTHSQLPLSFWGEALTTANYFLNKVNTKSKDLTPYEYWTGHKLDLSNLRVWRCKAHVLIPKPLRNKLKRKTWECKFIGYVQNGSGYRFYNQENGLIESRDAIFLESTNQITPLEEIRLQEDLDNKTQDHYKDVPESESKRISNKLLLDQQTFDPKNNGSKRIRRLPTMLKDYHLYNIEENLS